MLEVKADEGGNDTLNCETYLLCDFEPELLNFPFILSYTNKLWYVSPNERPQDKVIKYVKKTLESA